MKCPLGAGYNMFSHYFNYYYYNLIQTYNLYVYTYSIHYILHL